MSECHDGQLGAIQRATGANCLCLNLHVDVVSVQTFKPQASSLKLQAQPLEVK